MAKALQTIKRNIQKICIVNTSVTIVFGFSFVLSNFIPTIYFGVFTGIHNVTSHDFSFNIVAKINNYGRKD